MDSRYVPTLNQDDYFTFRERHMHRHDLAENLVFIAANGLVAALGFCFIFALFDANLANTIASFVYGLTTPFIAPFYSLFNYDHPERRSYPL